LVFLGWVTAAKSPLGPPDGQLRNGWPEGNELSQSRVKTKEKGSESTRSGEERAVRNTVLKKK